MFSRIWTMLSSYNSHDPNLSPVEAWAMRHKDRCSADEIITASIIQSFAKDWDNWKRTEGQKTRRIDAITECDKENGRVPTTITHKKKKITIEIVALEKSRDRDGLPPWTSLNREEIVGVNGLALTKECRDILQRAYKEIQEKTQRAKDAADKAKAEMEETNTKWALAERLLGMKRNEFGALVPVINISKGVVEEVEETCRHGKPRCSIECRAGKRNNLPHPNDCHCEGLELIKNTR